MNVRWVTPEGVKIASLLQRLQSVPEPGTAAENDRDLYQVHVIDQPLGEEAAYHEGAAAEVLVLPAGRAPSRRGVRSSRSVAV